MSSHQDQTFERQAFRDGELDRREVESCRFIQCDLSNISLCEVDFVDCRFEGCNLSMLQPEQCGMKKVAFSDCKLLGVDFGKCKSFAFEVSFSRCTLDFARFMAVPLKGALFEDCSIREANFTAADLTRARFLECNLDRAVFSRTKLEQADLRTARNFVIDPEQNRVAKAKFSTHNVAGLLHKYGIVVE